MMVLAYLAELLGTFLFILSILASGGNAFVVGGTLALIILLIGKVSGAHVNPVVSLVMLLQGSMTAAEFMAYVATQIAGAASGYYVYNLIY